MTASYEYHIGVDYHKSYSHLVVQDSSGNTLRSGRVKNDRQSLCGFLERYRENSHPVVEDRRTACGSAAKGSMPRIVLEPCS